MTPIGRFNVSDKLISVLRIEDKLRPGSFTRTMKSGRRTQPCATPFFRCETHHWNEVVVSGSEYYITGVHSIKECFDRFYDFVLLKT